ncbi:hypothetical protein KR084_012701 [Drosophila pseudotakahashii]|nr:hypothetical protein KR084_012701 [Drosophila pseudotakahashii]
MSIKSLLNIDLEEDENRSNMDGKKDDEAVATCTCSSALCINQSEESSSSSSESLSPSASHVPLRISSPWCPRPVGETNQSTAPASMKMSPQRWMHSNESSNPSNPRMRSKSIPPWRISPAAFVGYRYRVNADRGFALSK